MKKRLKSKLIDNKLQKFRKKFINIHTKNFLQVSPFLCSCLKWNKINLDDIEVYQTVKDIKLAVNKKYRKYFKNAFLNILKKKNNDTK